MKEPLASNDSFAKLQSVLASLHNIIFIAFHVNPTGAHMNAFCTYSQICLQFFRPKCYSYCKDMTKKCPGCALADPTYSRSADLMYNFPTTAPMLGLMVNVYKVGSHQSFDGETDHLIASCAMTDFTCCESVTHANALLFATTTMKIQL